jgi:hypothetical protein
VRLTTSRRIIMHRIIALVVSFVVSFAACSVDQDTVSPESDQPGSIASTEPVDPGQPAPTTPTPLGPVVPCTEDFQLADEQGCCLVEVPGNLQQFPDEDRVLRLGSHALIAVIYDSPGAAPGVGTYYTTTNPAAPCGFVGCITAPKKKFCPCNLLGEDG